ncbi:unnamed protein product [Blepharisma stoltei]|uniref:GB1/RHD3-type G domain-containing protein n=1 Tax=Blepharisma stoltei TaxID=1481888 RepID=A0AAU9J3Z0_9CILI|nr:unnamed protein product [Blepharisma stoltei]
MEERNHSFRYVETYESSRPDSPISMNDSMMKFQYIDEAIPLLAYNQEIAKYSINDVAMDFLKSLSAPISIVAITGMNRTGKSYFLNRVLLNCKNGFNIAASASPCTKGVWVWGRPLTGTTTEGETCSVVLMDTEGLKIFGKDTDHDTRIFSLATLLSSYLIYNSFGSIDENSIENLSFISSLTQKIQIKSQQTEEISIEEYGSHFPTFLWVVRDFSSQLINSEGDIISAKEYLELSLQPQKGASSTIDNKNKTRRFIKEFFKERDCCTLVKPTDKDEDIENLKEKEFEDLKLEFVEQIVAARKKILGKCKVKTINGKAINGQMLTHLVEAYIKAINHGEALNAENAWIYICKTECTKSLQNAQDIYEKILTSSISNRFPISEEELKLIHKEAKEAALEHFELKAIGDEKLNYLKQLKESLQEKYYSIKSDNELETKRKATEFLTDNYSIVDSKLRKGEFKYFIDYDKSMKSFQKFFLEHGPEGPARREILLDFCMNKISSTSDFFIKTTSNELDMIIHTKSEKISQLENDIKEIKEDFARERDEFQRKITKMEAEKAELTVKEQSMREQILSLKSERDSLDKEMRSALKNVRTENSQQLENANTKVWEYEEKMKEMERILHQQVADFQEEKALFDQKIKYLELTLEESRRREKEIMNELKNQKKDHNLSIKDLQSRYENQLKFYQSRLDAESERFNELEREYEEKENEFDREKAELEESEIRNKSIISEMTLQIENFKQKLERKDIEFKKKINDSNREHEISLQKMKNKAEDFEKKYQNVDENYKSSLVQWQKENAVLAQKLEFAEQYLQESKKQLEDERKQHENMIRSIQAGTSVNSEEAETQLAKLKKQYYDDTKNLEIENDNLRKRLSQQLEEIIQKYNELELKSKIDTSNWAEKEIQFQEDIENLLNEKTQLQDQVSDLLKKVNSSIQDAEEKFKKRIKALENQLEETKSKHGEEVHAGNLRAEQSYQQLKIFYEEEKNRLEFRLKEEKEKSEKKYKIMSEEYEDRIRQNEDLFDEELTAKEDEMHELEEYYKEQVNMLTHQSGLDTQKIETLEKVLKETKENLENIQKTNAQAIEQLQEKFTSERNTLLEKVEKQANDIGVREREVESLNFKKDQLESQLSNKEAELEDTKSLYEKEKQIIAERLENLKIAYQKISDELNQKKSDSKREMALAQQDSEFKAKRILELEKSLHDAEDKYSETVKNLKDESGQELSSTIAKLTQVKENLEEKLEQRKKQLKDIAASSSKQISSLEKEKAVLSEKLVNLDMKKNDMEKQYKQEIENLQIQLKGKKDNESTGMMEIQLENERLKTRIQEIEKDNAERTSATERERILWENKFSFLIQQRDQEKNNLAEFQKKFEATIEQFQKQKALDREKQEIANKTMIDSIESRYSSQIKDMQENHASTTSDLTEKVKNQEKEIRSLREEIELEKRGRNSQSGNMEKRLQELTENEIKILNELDNTKKDRDTRIEEWQEKFNSEVNLLRTKLSEYEKRAKESEQQRSQLFIDLEKERAKWSMEKDHLISQKNQALDSLEALEKRKELLLRENEKLRADKGSRRQASGNFMRRAEGTKEFKQGAASLFGQAGITFEEFSKDISSTDTTGQKTPSSSTTGEASPKPPLFAFRTNSPSNRNRPVIQFEKKSEGN